MTEMSFIVMNGCVSERVATATVIFSSVTGVEEEEEVQWPRSRDDGDCSHPGYSHQYYITLVDIHSLCNQGSFTIIS